MNGKQRDDATHALGRVRMNYSVTREDLRLMAELRAELTAALAAPVRVPCAVCQGASQYNGWTLTGAPTSPRRRGDCPAGCQNGYVSVVPERASS